MANEMVTDIPIERLAFGAAVHKKLKNNMVDTVGDLLEAFRTQQIRWMCSASHIKKIRQVLETAHIELPDGAAPAEKAG